MSLGIAKFFDTNLVDYKQSAFTKTLIGIAKCPIAPEYLKLIKRKEVKH